MLIEKLERVKDISKEDFIRNYYNKQKPVVLENYAKDWPAVKKWHLDYLKSKAGHGEVEVFGSWKNNNPTQIKMPPVSKMTFSEYIDLMMGDDNDFRLFLFDIFKIAPELKKDFYYKRYGFTWIKTHPVMFFGGGKADVRLHFDLDMSNVFLTQFEGVKRVKVFSPEYNNDLYKQPFSSHSNVDLLNIDFEKFPRLKNVKGFEAELRWGDTIFMPSGWWHHIEYVTPGFGLALRSVNSSPVEFVKGAYNVLVMKKIDDLLNKYYYERWAEFKIQMTSKLNKTKL
jgi:hypothetical protein